ncbi:MAG: AmmeMemoRadiSam system protein B [Candidatus Promineifilaceae bacterium]
MTPKLRPIQFQQVQYENQPMWFLNDPHQLTDHQMVLPYPLAKMVSMMDGTRSVAMLHQIIKSEARADVPLSAVTDAICRLDEALLLDNVRSQAAIEQIKAAWSAQEFRPPIFSGVSYPENSAELHTFLEAYSAEDTELAEWDEWHGRAIVAPHIDYQRGGHVYAKVWQRAKAAINDADLILIWGTDHKGGPASLTLSSIPYATPYGILPTDKSIVDELAATIGLDAAYELELNHKQEHSIELAAVWLHHLHRETCPVIPILIGSFYQFTPNGHPSSDPTIVAFLDKLRELTVGKKVLSIASVDLAHVGPAFDSDYFMGPPEREALRVFDDRLMGTIERGDKEAFYQQLASDRNANNVCGFSPTYLMLDYLGETKGRRVAYDQCSADQQDLSVVSICGMLLD